MPFIQTNEVNLYYEIHGKGEPLVLVAGLTCDLTFWSEILEELKRHFQLLIFDNRGVGRSDSIDQPYTIEDLASDTLSLIEQLGFKRPHILGHSMGGCIVQTLAFHQRDFFNKIIISNSLIKFNQVSTHSQQFLLKLWQKGESVQTLAEAVIPWIFSSHYLQNEQNAKNFIDLQVNHPYPQTLIGFKRQLEALLNFDSNPWFKQIQGPILIIGSDEDILCPRDSETFANHIKDAKFIEFHRVAHCPMHEKPKEYVGIIANFLK